jgi:hypothetical protein
VSSRSLVTFHKLSSASSKASKVTYQSMRPNNDHGADASICRSTSHDVHAMWVSDCTTTIVARDQSNMSEKREIVVICCTNGRTGPRLIVSDAVQPGVWSLAVHDDSCLADKAQNAMSSPCRLGACSVPRVSCTLEMYATGRVQRKTGSCRCRTRPVMTRCLVGRTRSESCGQR